MIQRILGLNPVAYMAMVLLFASPVTYANTEGGTNFAVTAAVYGEGEIKSAATNSTAMLASGMKVSVGDEITTGSASGLQVLLSDGTVFTLGNNTQFKLDQYTYNPASATGEIKVSILKGSYKVTTGAISKNIPGNVVISLPSGDVKLLGTVVAGESEEDGDTVVLLGPGAQRNSIDKKGSFEFIPKGAAVQTGEEEILVYKAGYAVTVTPDGTVSEPFEMTGREFGQLVSSLARAKGGSGDDPTGDDSTGELAQNEEEDGFEDDEVIILGEDLVEENEEDVAVGELDALLAAQEVTELADLQEISGLKGQFSETGIGMDNGGTFDFRFTFGTVNPGELDFIGFENINTVGVAGGEVSWDTAADGDPTFTELDLSLEDGTLVDKGCGCDEASIVVLNAGQGNIAKFFILDLDTGDDTFNDRLVKPGGNNNFPQP